MLYEVITRVFEISEMIHEKEASKNSRLIREIMKMVKGRLRENITLKDIAQQFSFSPNYLGYIFKEEVGKSFSEVLITMRMERARELLKDPTLKIYEVADQVGYVITSYSIHYTKLYDSFVRPSYRDAGTVHSCRTLE